MTECQYGSVLEKYESDYSWWEIVENARKLSTAVAMVLLALYGGAIQAWFIFGINIPYWLMVNKKRPYKPLHEGEKEREEEEDRLLFAARLKYHSISSAKEYASESASSDHDDDQVRPAAGVSGDYPDDDCDHSNQNEARCFYLIESSEVQYKRGEDYEEGKNGKERRRIEKNSFLTSSGGQAKPPLETGGPLPKNTGDWIYVLLERVSVLHCCTDADKGCPINSCIVANP